MKQDNKSVNKQWINKLFKSKFITSFYRQFILYWIKYWNDIFVYLLIIIN